jgi:hypothetical protein
VVDLFGFFVGVNLLPQPRVFLTGKKERCNPQQPSRTSGFFEKAPDVLKTPKVARMEREKETRSLHLAPSRSFGR